MRWGAWIFAAVKWKRSRIWQRRWQFSRSSLVVRQILLTSTVWYRFWAVWYNAEAGAVSPISSTCLCRQLTFCLFYSMRCVHRWVQPNQYFRFVSIVLTCVARPIQYFICFRSKQFEAHEFALDPKFGIFITINTSISNGMEAISVFSKAQFCAVSCIQPDMELICSVNLFADGFVTAKVLRLRLNRWTL